MKHARVGGHLSSFFEVHMNTLLRLATTGLVALLVACGGGESADTGHYAGGTVTGLKAGNSVHLSSGQQQLTLSADGTYRFGRFPSGTAYNIVATSTSSAQTCSIANGNGVITNEDIDNIAVTCADNHSVGGTLSGYQLASTPVRLSLNGDQTLNLSANGSFSFTGMLPSGSNYNVTVATQPPELTCTVTNGSGTVPDADVTNVAVVCAVTAGTVNVLVRGLTSPDALQLQLDGSLVGSAALASRQINAPDNGSYSFAAPVPLGSTYIVSVAQQPRAHVCAVSNGTGSFSLATPTVVVDCAPPLYSIGGTVWLYPGNSATISLYGPNQSFVGSVVVSRPPSTVGGAVDLPFSFGSRFPTGFSFELDASCDDFASGVIDSADASVTGLCFSSTQ